ncbi:phosphonopyruvate decarboxylase, partial [Ramlibacter sp.]|uniref:phosphonopyruvate decarboxylase n=1 Tax=Ramlibacter sp. TaxID=1917967 RepID=UPI0017F4BD5C
MISSRWFIDLLQARGLGLYAGVPCSFLSTLIDEVIARPGLRYVAASSEGEALSIVSGGWLGGTPGVVLCQNSGLGNMVSPLTSLNAIFRIPALLLISHRGKPGEQDEPQHELMGRRTTALLDAMEVPWTVLPKEQDAAGAVLETALATMAASHKPYALVVEKDSFAGEPARSIEADATRPDKARMTRAEALAVFCDVVPPGAAVIATTGKTGRELYTLLDRERNLYCVGSMGYANALAHGLALARPDCTAVVLDGDGAALMHLGNLATIGAEAPGNLVHLVLDNGQYDSTGGQRTAAASVDFCQAALALGYRSALRCATGAELAEAVRRP